MAKTHWGLWLHAIHPPTVLAKLAEAAEAHGAAAVLVADEGTDRDLFVTLAALAQSTRRVLLFGAVTNPHSRHPVATAAAFATLAELAPGRIVAGFGAGGSRVFGPMGLSPTRPFTALVECLDVVQPLLLGQTVHHTGEFTASAARLSWTPTGSIPLAIAGRGPRAERLAAERADWVLLAGRSVASIPATIARLRERGAARPSPPRIAWNPVAAWTDAMRDELRAHLAYMAVDMPSADRAALGLDESRTETLRQVVNTAGPDAAASLIPDTVLERYAIVGTRSEVVDRLGGLRRQVQPDLLVFDAHDYSQAFVADVAALAIDAGAEVFQN